MGNVFSVVRRHGNFIAGCVLAGFCVYEAADVLKAYAGKHSDVQLNFWLSLMANVKAEFVVSMTVSGLSIGLYLRERSKHRETRERLTRRVTELELKIDPNRTSSRLTSKGLTRKDDK
jgi:membrane protein implicated in regulation of membrane protease activity